MEPNGQQGVTSINQLPSAPQIASAIDNPPQNVNMMNSSSMNNIVLTKTDTIGEPNSQMQIPMQNPMQQQQVQIQGENLQMQGQTQANYNELINQLQQASAQGVTGLPTRDIPMNPTQTANDVEVKPNYVPPPPTHEDYINNMQTPEHLIQQNNKAQTNIDNLEAFYGEFQLPILIVILYFLFQLPIFKKNVKKILPSLFGNDGNPNLYGYFFNSALFSGIFYIILKMINNLNNYVN